MIRMKRKADSNRDLNLSLSQLVCLCCSDSTLNLPNTINCSVTSQIIVFSLFPFVKLLINQRFHFLLNYRKCLNFFKNMVCTFGIRKHTSADWKVSNVFFEHFLSVTFPKEGTVLSSTSAFLLGESRLSAPKPSGAGESLRDKDFESSCGDILLREGVLKSESLL